MKSLKKIPLLLLSLLFSLSLSAQQIILPVEVLGEQGKIVNRSVTLTSQQANSTTKLWLQINNLGYQNKGSIKINNGNWYELNHNSVDMHPQEKARGGMTHGGFNTIRFTIPANDFISGNNTISFRFNTSDGISIGYRVVRFNLLDNSNNKILPVTAFKNDDPGNWTAPVGYDNAASIAAGENIWRNAQLWNHYLDPGVKGNWYGQSLPATREISANCASCHTQDGRDLEIFSYSNESIIERAKFHKLDENQGKLVAAYIRSLSGDDPNDGDIGRYGRPWNPPYQPGTELIGKPIEQWAAGAGLDAVLEEDSDMAEYLFPNGISQETMYEHFDSKKSTDRTELPLSIQLPDWKHWLPIIHPMDAYIKKNYWNVPHYNGPWERFPKDKYQEYRQFLENNPNATGEELLSEQRNYWVHYREFLSINRLNGEGNKHWRTKTGEATRNLGDGISRELAATSLAKLMAVQNFEFVNEFKLQDKSYLFVDPENAAEDHPQPRQWFGKNYQVFEVPPHFQACVDNNCNNFEGQEKRTGFFESTAWYHLQMILNGGEGMIVNNSPVDWNYHPDFLTKASGSSGVYEPLRYYHSINTLFQTKTWSGGKSPNGSSGFKIRAMGPWNIYGISDGNQYNGFAAGEFAKTLENVQPGMTAWVMNAMLKQMLVELNQPFNCLNPEDCPDLTPEQIWKRNENGDDFKLDRANKTYEDIAPWVSKIEDKIGYFGHFPAKFYFYIPKFQELGVDCQIIEEIIDWCEKAWPLIDWSVFSNKGEMQLKLLLSDEDVCDGTSAVNAIATSVPNEVVYQWRVNGNLVAYSGSILPASFANPGDTVSCFIENNLSCNSNSTASANLQMPSNTSSLLMRTASSAAWEPFDNILACINDQIELKLELDIEPKLWLDAMNVNDGPEPVNNSLISTWYDKSGNGFTAEANNNALRPRYRTDAMNGLPAIVFGSGNNADGLELLSTNEDAFLEGDWTIMLTGKAESPPGNGDWRDLIGNKTEGANGWFYRFNGGNARVQMGIGNDLDHGKKYDFNRSFIVQIVKKGDVITCYINDKSDRVITKASDVSMTINKALYLGQCSNGNPDVSRWHKGPISELMMFDYAVSDTERRYLEGYLAHKWKLTEELSYTHNYANASPLYATLETPTGNTIEFSDTNTIEVITLDNNNRFGTYSLQKEACDDNQQVDITNENGLENSGDAIQYSINNAALQAASGSITLGEESFVKLLPNYQWDGNYEWQAPNGTILSQNTNPDFIINEINAGTWTLRFLDDLCFQSVQEFEIKVLLDLDKDIVHMLKRNAPDYAIDGGEGDNNLQPIQLATENINNITQQWREINRGEGYYSYQKKGTTFCIDGNNGGAEDQLVYLYECNTTNANQHWKKIEVAPNTYRLEKRNAPGFSIDGGNFGTEGSQLKLWNSSNTNENQHWVFDNTTTTPELVFITPYDGQQFENESNLEVSAGIQNNGNVITSVDLYINNNLVRKENYAPFDWGLATQNDVLLTNISSGDYTLKIIAYYGEGFEVEKEISITVAPETVAPEINFNNIADNESFESGTSLEVSAGIQANGNIITSVDLYINNTLVRKENSAPYEWGSPNQNDVLLANISPGDYTLKIVAYYNDALEIEREILISVLPTDSIVHFKKANSPLFAIDGGNGFSPFQPVILWDSDITNSNQRWIEINRGNGFYSYQKENTNFCIDGDNGGAQGQVVYLYECSENNENQHWKKIEIAPNTYRFEKRNAPEFSLDGSNGGANDVQLKLWDSNDDNKNQHWIFSNPNLKMQTNTTIESEFANEVSLYPNPTKGEFKIKGLKATVEYSISVYDIQGRIQFKLEKLTNKNNDINIESLSKGMYIIKINSLEELKVLRLIVN